MSLQRRLARMLALFRSRRLERELDDEVLAHLELAEHDARARGLDPQAARRDALKRFGGIDQMKEVHRDDRSVRWIENLFKDARYGFAGLRREPVFAAVAIGVIALGIGANTAMFSIVDAVLKPLPFPEPERIVRIFEAPTPTTGNSTTTGTFESLRAMTRSFEALSAESLSTATLIIDGEPTRLNGRYVSAGHFGVFGIQPQIGRTFRPEEDQAGAPAVVILSHATWQTYFGGDAAILGRELLLDNEPHRVIGVLPAGAFDRHRARPMEAPAGFWRLNAFTADERAASAHWLNPLARLKAGVSIEQAHADLLAVRAQIADTIPAWKKDWSIAIEPFDRQLVSDTLRQSIVVALGAVALVLLIACANLTNLLLSRSAARHKELAVRAALGAGRARLVTQLMTESGVLGALGGATGIALAAFLIRAAVPFLPLDLPFTADVALNWRVLAFAAAVALGVSAAVGVLPAVRLSSGPAAAALNHAARGSSGQHDRLRRVIVAAQVAVSLVLICGSVLLFKSLLRMQTVDIGARIDNVLTISIDLPWSRYPDGHHWAAFYPTLMERVRAIPGVESAAISGDVPLEGTGGENLRLPGRPERLLVRFKRADAAYFSTMGIPVHAGRGFEPEDRAGTPLVAVVNEELAARLRDTFGVREPVGTAVDLPLLGFGRDRRGTVTIVGVIGNERVQSDLRVPNDPVAYVPIAQAPRMQIKLAVRARGDAMTVLPSVREAIRQVDAQLALADIRTMEQIWNSSLSGLRQPVWLIGIFAALSALLAALGLYGVVAHSVAQRRREIGIRMALGARPNDVLSLVARHVLTTIVVGLIGGIGGAYVLTRVTRTLLFEVSALDPAAFALAALAMTAIALLAAVVPASRATSVDPTTALRSD